MEVRIDTLRVVLSKLLDHVERTKGAAVVLDSDFYWDISKEDRYDSHEEPSRHLLGQLSSDLERIESLASEVDDEFNYGLVWVAQVLRYLGELDESVD